MTLLGELPYDISTELGRYYGMFNKISDDRARMRMDPAKMLNLLGNKGYRVIGASPGGGEAYVWTMERKNFNMENNDREL